MKVVILSSRFPFPLEKGDKLRLFHQIKGLSAHHEVHLISLSDSEVPKVHFDAISEFCKSITIFRISKLSSAFHALRGLFNHLPFQVNYFYAKQLKNKLEKVIHDLQPDFLYCQLIRMAEYARDLNVPKVLDYMDAFSLNYTRRVQFESILKSIFFRNESKRLKNYEKEIGKEFDALTIISEQDRDSIKASRLISVISNGLDTDFFKPQQVDKPYQLLFVGNMGYHPNILAAKFIVNEVLPKIERNVQLKIAGARPSTAVRLLNADNVEVTGWVDDIRTAYASSKIFIAPIFSGAGQQNKILEAMAMGLICITTPIVNDAIKARDKKELFIATKAEDFANKIIEILENPEAFETIGLNARKFVIENFSWAKENKKLNDIIINCRKEKQNA